MPLGYHENEWTFCHHITCNSVTLLDTRGWDMEEVTRSRLLSTRGKGHVFLATMKELGDATFWIF